MPKVNVYLPDALADAVKDAQVPVQVGSRRVYDEFQWQALILTPDGKLVLRNGRDDTEDKDRQERLKEHREWIRQVESGRRTNPGQFMNPLGGPRGGGLGGSGS